MIAPKKNCAKKFLGAKRVKQNLFESQQLLGKLFCFSVAKRNFSNYFSAHASGACPDFYRDNFSGVYPALDAGIRKGHIKI